MENPNWLSSFPGTVMVCDARGILRQMNPAAVELLQKSGGEALLGSNILDCHPDKARAKFLSLMETKRTNTYTIEKRGQKRLVHQFPWYREGVFAGFVEISIPLPAGMPHFIRTD
jgi:transcriptional regulator with PAS, ATPase and Fis domain